LEVALSAEADPNWYVIVLEPNTTARQQQPRASLGATPQRFDYPAALVSRILAASRDEARSLASSWGARREGLEILRDAGKSVLFNAAKLSSEGGTAPNSFNKWISFRPYSTRDRPYMAKCRSWRVHPRTWTGSSSSCDRYLSRRRVGRVSFLKPLQTNFAHFLTAPTCSASRALARRASQSVHRTSSLATHLPRQDVMVVAMGVPTLPRRELDLALLDDALRSIFPDSTVDFKEIKRLAKLIDLSVHGTTLVVAMDAEDPGDSSGRFGAGSSNVPGGPLSSRNRCRTYDMIPLIISRPVCRQMTLSQMRLRQRGPDDRNLSSCITRHQRRLHAHPLRRANRTLNRREFPESFRERFANRRNAPMRYYLSSADCTSAAAASASRNTSPASTRTT
jgi:hypothetical protein